MFTARSRQRANPFAALSRQKAAAQKQSKKSAAPPEPEPEAVPNPEPAAVSFDRNPESEEYEQAPDIANFATGGVVGQSVIGPASAPEEREQTNPAPDISTYATGGVVPATTVEDEIIGEHGPEHVVPLTRISADTQAKIEAVMNHAIPPVAEERPDHPGPRGAEHMRPLRESAPMADESKRGRGRPRPPETIARDNAVHALLVGADPEDGISKESIAAELGEKEQQVYSSLRQLTKEGRAETRYVKPHGYRWFAV